MYPICLNLITLTIVVPVWIVL